MKKLIIFLMGICLLLTGCGSGGSGSSSGGGKNSTFVPEHSYKDIGEFELGEEIELTAENLVGTWITVKREIPEGLNIRNKSTFDPLPQAGDIVLTLNKDGTGSINSSVQDVENETWDFYDNTLVIGIQTFKDMKSDGRLLKMTGYDGEVQTLAKTTKVEKDSRLTATMWESQESTYDYDACHILDSDYNQCSHLFETGEREQHIFIYALDIIFKNGNKVDGTANGIMTPNLDYDVYDYGFIVVHEANLKSVTVLRYYFEDEFLYVITNESEYDIVYKCTPGFVSTTYTSLEEMISMTGIEINKDNLIKSDEYKISGSSLDEYLITIVNEEQTQYIMNYGDVREFIPGKRYVEGENYTIKEENGVQYLTYDNEVAGFTGKFLDMFNEGYQIKAHLKGLQLTTDIEETFIWGPNGFYCPDDEESKILYAGETDKEVALFVRIRRFQNEKLKFEKAELPYLDSEKAEYSYETAISKDYVNCELHLEFIKVEE